MWGWTNHHERRRSRGGNIPLRNGLPAHWLCFLGAKLSNDPVNGTQRSWISLSHDLFIQLSRSMTSLVPSITEARTDRGQPHDRYGDEFLGLGDVRAPVLDRRCC